MCVILELALSGDSLHLQLLLMSLFQLEAQQGQYPDGKLSPYRPQ